MTQKEKANNSLLFISFLETLCLLNMQANLVDKSANITAYAATLRQKLLIKLAISTSHNTMTPGHPVPALPLQCQMPGVVPLEVNFEVSGMTPPWKVGSSSPVSHSWDRCLSTSQSTQLNKIEKVINTSVMKDRALAGDWSILMKSKARAKATPASSSPVTSDSPFTAMMMPSLSK